MKPPLILLTASLTCFLAGWLTTRPAKQPPGISLPASLPAPSPLVVYSDRPWFIEQTGPNPTNTLASFMFTDHEWETICQALGPARPDGTLPLPQGTIRRLDQAAFDRLAESLPATALRTNVVWINMAGGGK